MTVSLSHAEFAPKKGTDLVQCDGSQMAKRRGRETRRSLLLLLLRFHLHFRVGGQCDESRHHSLSYQRLINPLHQQLIGLDRASRDVTEEGGAFGQERATPPIDREERKKNKKRKTEREGKEKQIQRDRKKVIYNDKNYSCKARSDTACIKPVYVHTYILTRKHTYMHTVCKTNDKN